MKIIFINRFFHPDQSATSQMLSGIAFGLAEAGHTVTVVTSRLHYDRPGSDLLPHETVRGVEIVRVPSSRRGRGTLPGRLYDYGTFYLAARRALLRIASEGDIIVAKTDPPLMSIGAARIARRRRAHLVNWLQDIFPETAERLGFTARGLGKLGFDALTGKRDASLLAARTNVVLGKGMQAFVASRGVAAQNVRTIPNWANGRLIFPVPRATNELRRQWGLQDAFVVGYSGNLGRAHDIETMLDAIALSEAALSTKPLSASLRTGLPTVRWLIIGSGSQNEIMQREVARRDLRSVVFKPYQSPDVLAHSLSAADTHVVTLKPALEGLIVPSKFYGIAAAGRSTLFIGDPHGEIGQLVARHDIGQCVREGDAHALADAVLSAAADPSRIESQGRRARALFETHYDLPHALAAWLTLIDEISDATRCGKP